jgi:hypothetical protein
VEEADELAQAVPREGARPVVAAQTVQALKARAERTAPTSSSTI